MENSDHEAQEIKNKHHINEEPSNEQQKVKKLQAELARNDKALAETAALLVLRGKFDATGTPAGKINTSLSAAGNY